MLNAQEIRQLVETKQLVTGYIELERQLQPSGFDLTLSRVEEYVGDGSVDFTNEERRIAETKPLKPDGAGWYTLQQGCYLLIYNETVKMPLDLVALARARSTMLRNGASVETAVWDPGYHGQSSSLLVVHNPQGVALKKNARVVQLVFFRVKEAEVGYSGVYQYERMKSGHSSKEKGARP